SGPNDGWVGTQRWMGRDPSFGSDLGVPDTNLVQCSSPLLVARRLARGASATPLGLPVLPVDPGGHPAPIRAGAARAFARWPRVVLAQGAAQRAHPLRHGADGAVGPACGADSSAQQSAERTSYVELWVSTHGGRTDRSSVSGLVTF